VPTKSAQSYAATDGECVPRIRANGLDIALSSSGDIDLVWVGKANSTSHFVLDVTGYWKQRREAAS
jgi:hypothetical protein